MAYLGGEEGAELRANGVEIVRWQVRLSEFRLGLRCQSRRLGHLQRSVQFETYIYDKN